MGRPKKIGVEYFPLDVDFFEDDKIQFLEATEGPEAINAYIRILCSTYRVGLCWRWTEVEQVAFARRCGVNVQQVVRWTKSWLKARLFDPTIYSDFSFLTSRAIQRRYMEIIRGRTELRVPEGVLLIDESELPNSMTLSFIDLKVKVKGKGNSEFPHVSTEKLEETIGKLKKTPKSPKTFNPKGKKKFKDWVYLDEKQIEEVENYYKSKGHTPDLLHDAIEFLDAWYANNQKMRNKYTDDAKILKGWPLDKAVKAKAEKLRLEREQSYAERGSR